MKKTENNLKENLKKISEIVSWFESETDLDLEKALEQIKLGAKLVKESKEKLKEIENEFKELKKDL
jgi:exonuclease VII small subunit